MIAHRRKVAGLGLLGAIALASGLAAGTSRAQEGPIRGVWTAQPSRWKTTDGGSAVVVQLSLRRTGSGHDWNSSFPVLIGDLKGLTPEQTHGPRTDVRFEIARDAGTITLEGRFEGGDGAGHYTFAANPDYVQDLRQRGYGTLDDEKVFSLATHDVSRGFIRELAQLGYARLPLDDLLNLRIHGASPEFVRELQALGYAHPSTDELVNLRIHGASPAFIRELKALGYERVPIDGLVNLRIHGASPEFVRDLRGLGYERIPVDDLVNMRIHGVSPEFIRRVNSGKAGPATVDRLVSLKIHGREE